MFIDRRHNRLRGYEYSHPGYYFITICVLKNEKVFGEIENGKSVLNNFGLIASNALTQISRLRLIHVDSFVVMPDHIYLIIHIEEQNKNYKRRELSGIIRAFKSKVSKKIHAKGLINFKWERSFYDRIISREKQLQIFRKYIEVNPLKAEFKKNAPH